jgi:glycosyltransferase involved in cell wall biosynthesis
MALKRLIVGQKRIERRLAALERRGDESREDAVTTHGLQAEGEPRVTAVVTVYNYEQYVGEALRSVALAEYDDLEVIVVDDASTDGSAEAARRALDEHPWLRATLVRRTNNRGLPANRNLGIELARGEYIFILDADNLVYPYAFDRLAGQLDASPDAAFAYGILEKFDQTGPYDLVSWIPWSTERLRFGNYIDAMAMIRRTALAQVGGYVEDERLVGWEDLDLWCKFAQARMHGVSVPQIVARYRAGHHSMLSVTNIDASDAWSLLVERHPFLASAEAQG